MTGTSGFGTQVISTFSTGKIPYVVKLNPDEDKQNVLLAGMSDKKIVQWDMNSGEIPQEYDQHLGAVNTITFVDNNRRFVTSSDDNSLRVWEFGIPVVIKYISEPHMHSMPSISLHPNTNWLAAQSLDNQILIYSTRERFQLNKKRRFAGHIAASYACQSIFHLMGGLSCLEMERAGAGFGTGKHVKFSELLNAMKVSA